MTPNLLASLDAAAELGKAATKRPWILNSEQPRGTIWPPQVGAPNDTPAVTAEGCPSRYGLIARGIAAKEDSAYIVAAVNLDHAAIAAALRAKDAEIERLREECSIANQIIEELVKTATTTMEVVPLFMRYNALVGLRSITLAPAAGDSHD